MLQEYLIYELKEETCVQQTKTKARIGFKASAKDYNLTYYIPKYKIKDTEIPSSKLTNMWMEVTGSF